MAMNISGVNVGSRPSFENVAPKTTPVNFRDLLGLGDLANNVGALVGNYNDKLEKDKLIEQFNNETDETKKMALGSKLASLGSPEYGEAFKFQLERGDRAAQAASDAAAIENNRNQKMADYLSKLAIYKQTVANLKDSFTRAGKDKQAEIRLEMLRAQDSLLPYASAAGVTPDFSGDELVQSVPAAPASPIANPMGVNADTPAGPMDEQYPYNTEWDNGNTMNADVWYGMSPEAKRVFIKGKEEESQKKAEAKRRAAAAARLKGEALRKARENVGAMSRFEKARITNGGKYEYTYKGITYTFTPYDLNLEEN